LGRRRWEPEHPETQDLVIKHEITVLRSKSVMATVSLRL